MKGQLYGPGPGAGVPCEVDVRGGTVVAVAPGGVVEFAPGVARFGSGGLNGSLAVIEREGEGGILVLNVDRKQLDAALRASGGLATRNVQAALARDAGRLRVRVLAGWLVGVAALATLTWGLIAGAGAAVDWVVTQVPVEWEEGFGDAVLASAAPESRRIEDGPLAVRVRLVMERLQEAAQPTPYDFVVVVVEDETPNAFAAPGGRMAVHSALVRDCVTADELAGVLAHEIEHVRQRHHLRSIANQVKWSLLLASLTGDLGGGQDILFGQARDLLGLKHDRDQEREADRGGFDLAWDAGFDPQGMVTVFERLAREDPSGASPPLLLSTHPGSAERAESVREELARRGAAPVRPLEGWPDADAVDATVPATAATLETKETTEP